MKLHRASKAMEGVCQCSAVGRDGIIYSIESPDGMVLSHVMKELQCS